jgi:hypothetical protein
MECVVSTPSPPDGVVQNPTILSFQNREEEYPHRVRG